MKHFGIQTELVAAHESTTTKRMDWSENPSQGGSDLAYQVQRTRRPNKTYSWSNPSDYRTRKEQAVQAKVIGFLTSKGRRNQSELGWIRAPRRCSTTSKDDDVGGGG